KAWPLARPLPACVERWRTWHCLAWLAFVDLGERAADFRRERAKPFAAARAIAGLAGLLERGGGGGHAGGADRLRRAFELVRGGCDRRKIAGARGCRDMAFGLDRGVAEFRQPRA